MATKVLFRKRKFLNRMGYHSGAFIFAEILRESWTHKDKKTKEKSTHSHRDITLSIADCSRIINLDFNLGYLPEASNGLKKLDLYITRLDIARLPSYAIAGIGFLGSGIIIQNRNRVEGITTASTLWSIVSVGLLVGHGYYFIAGLATLFIYLILILIDTLREFKEAYTKEMAVVKDEKRKGK